MSEKTSAQDRVIVTKDKLCKHIPGHWVLHFKSEVHLEFSSGKKP